MDEALLLQRATIVFDLDGTVADTARDLVVAANAALISEGFEAAPASAILPGVGYGTKAMLRSALAATGHEADSVTLQRLADRLVAHYEDHIAVHTKPFPGFIEAASELRAMGAVLALCTNKRERLARKLLQSLEISHFFDAIAGGDTFPFHKPDPRHITELVRLAGRDPACAIMIGDSEADVAAAKAAGVPCIAVTFGYAAIPAENLGADDLMSGFSELKVLVKRFLLLECQQD